MGLLQPSVEEALAAWGRRVRENREQVDRVREVEDGADFYGPVSSMFRADPRREDDPALEVLRSLVEPGETWLDIGAGGGRYALPLALLAGEVIALEPSEGMLAVLREGMAEHGIQNIRIVQSRWPPAEPVRADVALIAHVGYDIEAIGPFLDAMDIAARRLCVAVLMERPPASVADPFWPPVHGEARLSLPALPEFMDLLRTRRVDPSVTRAERAPRRFVTRDELIGFLRRQLWIADGGEKERRFLAALDELAEETPEGWALRDQRSMSVGVVTWKAVAAR
jgi:SAM-dependent methyltransferase